MNPTNELKRIDIEYMHFAELAEGGSVVGIYEDGKLQVTLLLVQETMVFARVLQHNPVLSERVLGQRQTHCLRDVNYTSLSVA